ncbi:MAG: hypothetical protein IJV43_09215 [Oscillospiraceae bacterium]|nr:hypothetical protein [Oscillospiraceae bacterium]
MNIMEEKQAERLLEMLRWLLENPAEITILCEIDSASARDVQKSIEKLEARGYYEFLLILLLKHQEEREIYCAIAQYLTNRLDGFFRENGVQAELALFKTLLAEQFL